MLLAYLLNTIVFGEPQKIQETSGVYSSDVGSKWIVGQIGPRKITTLCAKMSSRNKFKFGEQRGERKRLNNKNHHAMT